MKNNKKGFTLIELLAVGGINYGNLGRYFYKKYVLKIFKLYYV